jgi:hypothetical protein
LTTRISRCGKIGLGLIVLGLAGCATPGPNHTYVASRAQNPVIDLQPGHPEVAVPTYLSASNTLYGIAYDPFTDHLFLRVYPGNFIRVIDRPARKIKRSFTVAGLPVGGGDLAIRSSDRHLFFAHPTMPAVIESTLYGQFVRTLSLDTLAGPPAGVAYDQKQNRLYILSSGEPAQVSTYDLTGKRLGCVTLERDVSRSSLAYDSGAAEFHLRLSGEAAIGVFNRQGVWQRSLPLASTDPTGAFIDVGPRSLLRLF